MKREDDGCMRIKGDRFLSFGYGDMIMSIDRRNRLVLREARDTHGKRAIMLSFASAEFVDDLIKVLNIIKEDKS